MTRARIAALLVALLAIVGCVSVGSVSAAATPENLFGATVPAVKADPDTNAVELGVQFRPAVDGTVSGVRFYKGTGNTGTHSGSVWSSSGTRLATGKFTGETASGWQTMSFAAPVAVTAGTTYTASYYAPKGHYAVENPFAWPKVSGNLTGVKGTYRYGATSGFPTSVYQTSNYWVDVTFTANTVAPPTTTPVTTSPVTTTTPSTTVPVTTTAPPTTTDPTTTASTPPTTTTTPPPSGGTVVLGRSFPNADTTGVPAGTVLTPYTGPCLIDTPDVVIDSKTVSNCDEIRVFARGLIIRNSVINGHIYVDYNANVGSFTITDSEVHASPDWPDTGIGDAFFTATRVEVTGGSRSINCYAQCTVQDSYVHGQMSDPSGSNHESGIRVNTNSHLIHNTITCDAPNFDPDAGCSAAITGYPDFDPVTGNVIQNNLIDASTGAGYCAYGGSTGGKPYSGQTKNVTFADNIWRRGTRPGQDGSFQCGYWGPITSFDVNAPGNVWSNNLFDDGSIVQPAN